MFGKTFYGIWIEKYGKKIADKKLLNLKNKHKKISKGAKNPMYGKPSPQGSGNGWSGWYNGWYFRSLRELTYMIKIIERFKLNWISGENNDYKIKYVDYDGKIRNYFPDFVINKKYLIECKPKRLWNSVNIKRKKTAAIKFSIEKKLKYKMIDVGKLSNEEIFELHRNKKIKFIDRYERKFNEKYANN